MSQLIEKLDSIAGIESGGAARLFERAAFIFLVLMALAAPHSIAATQTAWLLGLVCWIARLFIKPHPSIKFGWLEAALFAFVSWSVLSAFLSYEPAISIDKLRGVGLFLILFFALYNLRTLKAVRLVAFALIASCMVNVVWTPVERLIGRGVEIHGVKADGVLGRAGMTNGDTILKVNGKRVGSPEEAVSAISSVETAAVIFHRPDADKAVTIRRTDLVQGGNALNSLGIEGWQKNRKWRAKGFYGHFTTYSEVLQLIGSLVLGLLIAAFLAIRRKRILSEGSSGNARSVLVFAACFGAICIALLLSGTRASQLGLMISAFAIVAAVGSRKLIVAMMLLAIPAGIAGYTIVQQTRQQDENNEYRKTMWRDGIRLATESPRHLAVGVGMDSLKKRWPEWGLFDGGNLPMGHFHSTPIQIAAERGIPALIFWLTFLAIYARTLWRAAKLETEALSLGIILGCLGGLAGFFTSGIVHYNLGDGEVAMVFYLLAGIGLAAGRLSGTTPKTSPVR